MGNDLIPVNRKIYQRILDNDIIKNYVGLHPVKKVPQIYYKRAPKDHTKPCLVFAYMGAGFRRGTGGKKICAKMVYNIKFITEGDSIVDLDNPLTQLEILFTQDQLFTDDIIMGMSCSDAFDFGQTLDGGVEINYTGYIVEIFTYNTL